MVTRAKPVNWPGVRWSAVDDARLLVGVMEHGIGNWDSIRDDPNLNLGSKVLITTLCSAASSELFNIHRSCRLRSHVSRKPRTC